jgi:hypothetical protein
MRTGVPVEALREFNAAVGNELPPDTKLQVGAEVHVPLGAAWQTERVRDAAEVARMVEDANRKARTSFAQLSPLTFPEVTGLDANPGEPVSDDSRSRSIALLALDNDFKAIEDDVKRSGFQWNDPSTYVDTQEDRQKYAARDAYKKATDQYASVLRDPLASAEALVAARNDLLRARGAFDQSRGVVDQAAASSNYLTPLREASQNTQEAVHAVTGQAVDAIVKSGAPAPLVAVGTLPIHIFDNVVDFNAGAAQGGVDVLDGVAGVVAHPVNTAKGVFSLIDRAAQTTSEGQAFEFFAEAAFGRYATLEEAAQAWQKRMDPLTLGKAKLDLATDLGKAFFAESIQLAKEGKYFEAAGRLGGQQTDLLIGMGALKGGRLNQVIRAADAADASRAARIADTAADLAPDATRLTRAAETVPAGRPFDLAGDTLNPTQRTPAGITASRLEPTSRSSEQLLLPAGNPTTRTLDEVRRLRGPERWQAAEEYVREIYGSFGERHFPVPGGAWPEPIDGVGGRFIDAPVDLGGGRVLANEVKTYREWRTVRGAPQQVAVPLTDQIRQQVLKDVWLRRHVPGYDPRWMFLDAPPSSELAAFLKRHSLTHIQYK